MRHLDLLGGALADQHVVLALHVVDDRFVHLVAAAADRAGRDDSGERDHRDVGGAAADVDDHAPGRGRDVEAGADRRRHRLLDQVDLARSRRERRLADRPLLDAGDAGRHADHDARAHQLAAAVRALDEVAEHRLGDLEVRDHAVLDRADRADAVRRAPEHLLGLVTDRDHLLAAPARVLGDRDHARLRADEPLAADVDEGVGGAEIDGEVVGERARDEIEVHRRCPSAGGGPRNTSGVSAPGRQKLSGRHPRISGSRTACWACGASEARSEPQASEVGRRGLAARRDP